MADLGCSGPSRPSSEGVECDDEMEVKSKAAPRAPGCAFSAEITQNLYAHMPEE